MKTRRYAGLLSAAILALLSAAGVAQAQMKFLKGQSVVPVFEGWHKQPDGTYVLYFGYLNRNYEQTIDEPVGPNNQFEPGPADRGQPTFFGVRRQRFLFQVPLPKDWDPKARLTWTVVANGQTEKAQGWLQPEWEIDDGVMAMNIGGGSSPPMPNAAPKFSSESETQTASVSRPLTLTVTATDDGVPKPRPIPKESNAPATPPRGASIRWMKYRGPGDVKFSVEKTDGVYGKPVESTTAATFSAPGDYILKAIASDGYLQSFHTVTVTAK